MTAMPTRLRCLAVYILLAICVIHRLPAKAQSASFPAVEADWTNVRSFDTSLFRCGHGNYLTTATQEAPALLAYLSLLLAEKNNEV
jgi:hypothetical protein